MRYKNEVVESGQVGIFGWATYVDTDAESPREQDNLGTLITWERDDSPDPNPYSDPGNSAEEFQEAWEKEHASDPLATILPVYKIDHSGVAYSTIGFNDPWDSGQIGWIFTTGDAARSLGFNEPLTPKRIGSLLIDEVETYSLWANGECYGYVITNTETDEVVEDAWGLYGAAAEVAAQESARAIQLANDNTLVI